MAFLPTTATLLVPPLPSRAAHGPQVSELQRDGQRAEARTSPAPRIRSDPAFDSQHQHTASSLAQGTQTTTTSRHNGTGASSSRPSQHLPDHRVMMQRATSSAARESSPLVRPQQTRSQVAVTKSSVELENDRLKRSIAMVQAQLQDVRNEVASKTGEARVIRDRWNHVRDLVCSQNASHYPRRIAPKPLPNGQD